MLSICRANPYHPLSGAAWTAPIFDASVLYWLKVGLTSGVVARKLLRGIG